MNNPKMTSKNNAKFYAMNAVTVIALFFVSMMFSAGRCPTDCDPDFYFLGTSASPGGSGSVSGGGSYLKGVTATVTATPAAGYTFMYWSGSLNTTSNPASIVMNSDKTVIANFSGGIQYYTLTVTIASNGYVVADGTLFDGPSPPNFTKTYTGGSTAHLTAVPEAGYDFAGWSGDVSGTSDEATIVMSLNKSVTATFRPEPTVTLTSVDPGATTADTDGPVVFIQHKPGNTCDVPISTVSDPDPAIAYATGTGNINTSVTCTPNNNPLFPIEAVAGDTEYPKSLCDSGEITSAGMRHELNAFILNNADPLTGAPIAKTEIVQVSGPAVDMDNTLSNSEGKGGVDSISKAVFLPGAGNYQFRVDLKKDGTLITQADGLNLINVLVCPASSAQIPTVHAVKPDAVGTESNKVVAVQGAALSTDLITLEGSVEGSADSTKWLASADVNITSSSLLTTTASFSRKTGNVLLMAKKGSYKKVDMVKYVFPEGAGDDAVIDIEVAGSACTSNPPAGSFAIKPGPNVTFDATASGTVAGRLLKYGNTNEYTAGNVPVQLPINEEGRGKLVWICPPTGQKALTLHRAGPGHVGFGLTGDIPTDENIRFYNTDSQVELTAFPEEGYSFAGWNGDVFSGANPYVVNMTGNRYVVARFVKNAVPAGIVKMRPDPFDSNSVEFFSLVSLEPNVPDLVSPFGIVNTDDEERFLKCVNGSGNQPFGANLLDPGELDYCYQSDFDGDGDVDDDDTKIMKSCLANSDHPAPGFACLGSGSAIATDFNVTVLKDGSQIDQLTNPSTYEMPSGQPGLYTFKTTAGSVTRTVQVKLPILVRLDLGRSEDGIGTTDEGHILVEPQGLGSGPWDSCPATVQSGPWVCDYPPGTVVKLTAIPGTAGPVYRFVEWEIQQAPANTLEIPDPLKPKEAQVTLDWADGDKSYVIKAVMVEDS